MLAERNSFFFYMVLVLALVDCDNLLNQLFEFLRLTDCDKRVFDSVLEANVEENTFRVIVELQGSNDLLELDRVCSGRFGLFQAGKSITGLMTDVSIEVKNIKGLLKGVIAFSKGMGLSVENVSSPAMSIPSEERNDEQNFRFTGSKGFGVDSKMELILGY